MQKIPIREIPKYECLLKTSERYPDMDAWATMTFLHLIRTSDELYRGVADTFSKNQISKGRFMIMMQLFNKEDGSSREVSPAEMAEKVEVTRATVSGLLDGLEKDGLAVRKQDEKDRRMVVVKLTQAGIDMMEAILPVHFARLHELMSVLTLKEKKQLLDLLCKLCDHVSEVIPAGDGENKPCCM